MAAACSILSMGEGYVLPSSNSSKPYQYLVDTIGLDHNYSRSWSEREKIPYARPAKELFTRQPHSGSELSKNPPSGAKISKDEIIDVVTVEGGTSKGPGAISMQYDVAKSKVVMSECEKFVSSASNKKTPDTWEELICRTGWTTQQNVLFDKILKIVSAYRLAWLTYQGSPNEPVLRRVAVDKATKRVRQIFSRIEWDIKLTTWLHGSMVDGLSIPLLACYLDIIQTLRSKVPSLVDKMVVGSTAQRRVSTSTTDNMTALLKRPWEATVGLTSFQRPRKITGTPLLLIVPGGPTTNATGNSTKRSRFWHHHLSSFGKVNPVTMHLSNSGRSVSIGQCLDHMIGAVQAKVLELKNHFPNRPVILIGWSTGALVSFQVALKEKVCAVVCLGFPLFGVEGLRGGANDPFLDCKTPTMFVIGSLSTACSLRDIEEFRKKLLADTSLLVIGGADYQLRLTSAKKNMEGVTQSVVDRRIMDDIGEFLNHAVSSMNDDSHPRLNYFEFDDIESRRKKPKTESRKRPQTDANKKPRARSSKPGNTQESGTKKPKTVKNSKKAPAMKSVVLVPTSNQPSASTAATHLPGNIPIAPIRNANSAIPGGILQGVTVPLTGVNGPISGVSVALSGVSPVSIPGVRIPSVNVPVSAVNVPVSAVIKQGSLGGRSFVFSCSPSTNPNPGSTNAVVATPGIATISSSGTTQHLKIVMHPSADGAIKVTNPPKTAMSSELPSSLQYKTAILTASLPAKPGASNRTPTTDGSTCRSSAALSSNNAPQCSAVTETSAVSSRAVISESPVSSPIIVTSPAVKSLSTPTTTARAVTSSNVLSLVGRPVSCTSSTKRSTSPSVVTVPKSPIPGGQAQYFVHRAQLAAISKQGTVSVSPGNPSVTSPPRPLLSTAGPRVKTPTNTKPQTVGSSLPSKQTTVRVSQSGLAQTTCGNVLRKTPSSQSVTPTIQVGVKRTVTYNPSTTTKTVTVVSRPLPSAALTTLAPNATAINLARLKEKLKTISNLSTLSIGSNVGTVLLKPTQLLNEQLEGTRAQNLSQGNAEQTSTSASTGSTAQITSEISTQSSFHSVAQAVSSIKSPSLSKSSLPSTSFPTTAPADASSIVQVLLSSVETSVSQSSLTTNTRMAEKSNVLPSVGQSLPSAAPISVKSTAQSSLSSTVETSAKSSVLLSGPSNTLSNKPTSIETSVQAGKVSCGESSGQSGSQSSSEASSESVSQRSEPASSPKSNTQPGGQLTSPKTVKEGTPTTVETKPRIVQTTSGSVSISSEQSKTKPLPSTSGATKAATSAATTLEHESTGSETARNENEHKLAEKVSDVAKGVVGGSQRTTRQSVRRLEAAAKLAGAEQKRGENENDLKEKS